MPGVVVISFPNEMLVVFPHLHSFFIINNLAYKSISPDSLEPPYRHIDLIPTMWYYNRVFEGLCKTWLVSCKMEKVVFRAVATKMQPNLSIHVRTYLLIRFPSLTTAVMVGHIRTFVRNSGPKGRRFKSCHLGQKKMYGFCSSLWKPYFFYTDFAFLYRGSAFYSIKTVDAAQMICYNIIEAETCLLGVREGNKSLTLALKNKGGYGNERIQDCSRAQEHPGK